jgi:phosphoribosylglycinamide formyltransferase-1
VSKLNIAVLVSGNGSNLQALIDAASQGIINGKITAVISDRKDAYALERAKKHGIDAMYISKEALGSELLVQLKERKVGLVVLAGFLSILSSDITKEYEGRIINIHPSLIPAFCGKGFYGGKVHRAVIDYGVKVSGATVHFVDEGTDSGPIILQQAVAVAIEDTAETLAARVLEVEHRLLVEAVALFCDGRLSLERRRVRIL